MKSSPLPHHIRSGGPIVHILFAVGIISKGIDGILEIAGGGLLFFVSPARTYQIIRILTQHELSEDPHDLIAGYLLHLTQHLSADAQIFGAVYLFWHGMVKAGLVIALLLKQRWVYPAAIAAFLLFLAYQLYRYSHTGSPALLVLSAVDLFVILITWLEYRRLLIARAFS